MYIYDIETRASVSVVDRGLAAHASDPDTDILTVCAMKHPDGEVLTWRGACVPGGTDDWDHMEPFLQHIEAGGLVVAHNEAYDRTVWNAQADKYGLPHIKLEQSICSAAWLRQFNLPSKLGDVSKRLLPPEQAKLTDVATGIKYIWSKKNPLVSADDVRANERYCAQDVTSVAALMRLVPPPTQQFLDEYHACARMNDRGICVDLDMALAAQTLKPRVERQLLQEIGRICGPEVKLRGPSFLKWLQANLPEDLLPLLNTTKKKRVGYEFRSEKKISADKSVRAKLLEAIEDRTDCGEIRNALFAFDEANRAAVGKYKAMLKVEHNGVVHNQFVFSGAAQTGRASSHGIQLQNTLRDVPKNAAEMIDQVKELQKHPSILESKVGSINVALGRLVRPTLIADAGNALAWSDWSAIEARMLPWLSNDAEDLLDVFRNGGDVYVREAAGIYGVSEQQILDRLEDGDPDAKEMRQVGKVAILACLSGDTKVLTKHDGHVSETALVDVTTDHMVWDGVEWVVHDGLVNRGKRECLTLSGMRLTPDHLIWCGSSMKWITAEQVESNESIKLQALESGSECLPSQATWSDLKAASKASWSSAIAADLNIASKYLTSEAGALSDATHAPKNTQPTHGRKHTYITQVPAQTSNTAAACSTASPLCKADVIIQTTSNGCHTAGEVSRAGGSTLTAMNASEERPEPADFKPYVGSSICSDISSRLTDGITLLSNLIASTTTKAMNPATCGLSPEKPTWIIEEPSMNYHRKSNTLKNVYDLRNAGPRNRFTVITDDGPMIVHNCGYQGGVGAFQAMAKNYGMKVSDERADEIKSAWRKANAWAPKLWHDAEAAAMRAVRRPGEIQQFGRLAYIFAPDLLRGTLLLFMPSGRFLAYPEASIAQVTKFDQPTDTLVFIHPEYGPSATYGGALVQGATQGEAASLLRTALVECDKAGIESIGQVHDEIIIEHPDDEIESRTAQLVKIMETPPDWATGLPLNAEAEIGYRYKVPR